MNREQIDQLIQTLFTLRTMLRRAEDLSEIDSILRITFAHDYYEAGADMMSVLLSYPLSGEN